ncbi:hypothetical protein T484DRAFT_1782953 [Baffinella frigidus]|nr:hypothetical protein T484DRAFT_1782953 [Cryptophyta sp. CCMP2293]
MEFLRREKMQPGFSPNLRHCIYGLGASLGAPPATSAIASTLGHVVAVSTDGG